MLVSLVPALPPRPRPRRLPGAAGWGRQCPSCHVSPFPCGWQVLGAPWAFGPRMGDQPSACWSSPIPVVVGRQRAAREVLGHAEHGHPNAQAAVSADRGHCASPPRPQGLLSALATGCAWSAPRKRQRCLC